MVEMYLAAHWERLMTLLQVQYAKESNRSELSSPSQEAAEDLHKVVRQSSLIACGVFGRRQCNL